MTEKNKRNKGGRPKKEKTRNMMIRVRVYEEEYAALEEKSVRLNYSISEFLRESALNVKVLEKREPKEVVDVQRELTKIGTNVNQVARKLNQNVQTSDYFLKKEVQDIKNKLADIFDKLS